MERAYAKKSKRKRNFLAEYFKNFGLRQTVGLVITACAIALIFGLIFKSELTLLIGFSVYAAAAFLSMLMSISAMTKNHRRSPEFKRAMVNLIIMTVIFAVALFASIYTGINGIFK
ncbi:MAG TPA: hypothetical protein VIL24_00715 [Clostridia bacterium]